MPHPQDDHNLYAQHTTRRSCCSTGLVLFGHNDRFPSWSCQFHRHRFDSLVSCLLQLHANWFFCAGSAGKRQIHWRNSRLRRLQWEVAAQCWIRAQFAKLVVIQVQVILFGSTSHVWAKIFWHVCQQCQTHGQQAQLWLCANTTLGNSSFALIRNFITCKGWLWRTHFGIASWISSLLHPSRCSNSWTSKCTSWQSCQLQWRLSKQQWLCKCKKQCQ